MNKRFLNIVIMFSLLNSNVFCQNDKNNDTIEIKVFRSSFFLENKVGELFVLNTNDNKNNAIIRWGNGWFAIGNVLKGNVVGEWQIFDKKNRCKEYLILGFETQCLLYSKKMDKKGKIISEFKIQTPCF